ncbi:MAG: hypothetical protein QW350_04015 [Candidatus Aenigmatarchaeota archaeon]
MDLESLIAATIAKVVEKKVEGILGQKQDQKVDADNGIEIESVDRSDLESNAKSA